MSEEEKKEMIELITPQKTDKDYEEEKAVNDLQRETFITKTLQELTVDLMVCKLLKQFHKEAKEPLEEWKIYLEKFKKEIDNLYERISKRKI